MKQVWKNFKKKFGKGFTFLIVPNSGRAVKSYGIPVPAVLVIIGIIVCNIYIFFGFTIQIGQIYHFRQDIHTKKIYISKLENEQREVKPTLQRSFEITQELNRLKTERAKILNTWRAIQQKGGRIVTQVSRGSIIRPNPYILQPSPKENGIKTDLAELQNNLNQISGFMKEEDNVQNRLLKELLAYERKLDHTPSIWPIRSFITSWFGNRLHPKLGFYREHTGVDIQARYGSKVCAAAAGVVKTAGWNGGYGYTVIIDHGYGYETLYGHNSQILVHVGQTVKKGQIICFSGNSGVTTGPHLHYEVRVNGHPVNPVLFFRK